MKIENGCRRISCKLDEKTQECLAKLKGMES